MAAQWFKWEEPMDAASLRCHPEHIRSAQGKLREGSVALGMEMLRCAQHDSTFRLPLPQGMVIGNFLGSSESLSQEGNRSATEEHLSYEVVRLWRMIS
jgi:hypothetical protein